MSIELGQNDSSEWRSRDIGEPWGEAGAGGEGGGRAGGGRERGRHVTSEAAPGATVCRSPATRPHPTIGVDSAHVSTTNEPNCLSTAWLMNSVSTI